MENHYFSVSEDQAFSAVVLRFNAMKAEEDPAGYAAMENRIRERTSVLLYLIPMRNLYLPREDAGEFFLDIQKDLSWIIRSFRISGLTYNSYLTQICRYRVMRFMRKKAKEKNLDTGILFSDMTIHEPHTSEPCIPYYAKHADVSSMDLPELSRHIIRNHNPSMLVMNDKEKELTQLLQRPIKRRQFISFLLSLPETETPGFIAGVSRLLRIDIDTASRFYTLRHEALQSRNGAMIESLEMTAGRHWIVLVRLSRAINVESSPDKRNELEEKYRKLSRIYMRRRKDIARAHCGLTHKAIGDLLGISRSCVSHDISVMRSALERISSVP